MATTEAVQTSSVKEFRSERRSNRDERFLSLGHWITRVNLRPILTRFCHNVGHGG
jgi:hypothetical protein